MRRWAGRLPGLAAAGFLVASALWLHLDRRIPREAFVPGSVHNTGPEGMSLARAYLARAGRKVDTLGRPVARAFLPADAVLFRLAPAAPPPPPPPEDGDGKDKKKEKAPPPPPRLLSPEEEAWVRGGGRLVLAVARPYAQLSVAVELGDLAKVFPASPAVRRLEPPVPRVLSGPGLEGAVALWTAGAGVMAARRALGKGEIVLLGIPEIFQNRALGAADHLAWLDVLAGAGRPVWFDEHVHGLELGAGMLEILRAWGFGPLLVLAGLAAATAFWRGRSRLGPAEDDARETRVEAVEFVDSLALLYDRALGRRPAIDLYRQAFEKAVAARTGLRGDALKARAVQLLGPAAAPPPGDLTQAGFERSLAALNDAFRRLDHEHRRGRGRALEARRRRA